MRQILLLLLLGLSNMAVAESPVPQPPVSPIEVKDVVVTLSGTSGFARDVALEQAARQALPQVLTGAAFGLSLPEATKKTKILGEVMPLVAKYNIVRESVLPTYSLTADITFSEALLRKNFGAVVNTGPVSTSPVASNAATMAPAPAAPSPITGSTRYVVRVTEPSAAGQDRARRALNALPSTVATLRLVSPQGVEFEVATNQPTAALNAALAGFNPQTSVLHEVTVPRTSPSISTSPAAVGATPVVVAPATEPATPPAPPTSPARRNVPAWLPDFW